MTESNCMSILIVEDEANILTLHRKNVEGAGHKVYATATTLTEALATLQIHSGKIDAALLDLNLKGELSEPVAKALKAANIPFLILTGYTEEYVHGLGINAPVLNKPFRRDDLISALEALSRS